MTSEEDVAGRVAEVARLGRGRLVALLAGATRDVGLAEDAVADAFERALRALADEGSPRQPRGVVADGGPQPGP